MWQEALAPRSRKAAWFCQLDRVDLIAAAFGQKGCLEELGLAGEGDKILDRRIESKCVDVVTLALARDSQLAEEKNRDGLVEP